MSFTSLAFLAFFAAVALGWYALPGRLRKPFLLIASYGFYMAASPVFGLLLAAVTAVSYLAARAHRRIWTGAAIGLTLLPLLVFKYADFLGSSLLGGAWRSLGLAMPVGISFFTFSVLGYLFDVYRGKLTAERSLVDYALFVAFFPCILSGPVGWARSFLPQLKGLPAFELTRFKGGMLRFACGAAKKLVCADLIGTMVDAVYADVAAVSGGAVLMAACLYSLQIYFDFSGYSDMAIGIADALGFEVAENFRAPYLSTSVRSFWKKWHMSLTGWFREYLYFPLGGSRRGTVRTCVNVLIVFAVSGLWHGAAWTFVLWGLLNGIYQVTESLLEKAVGKPRGGLRAAVQGLLTFLLITLAWVFFRAEDLPHAVHILSRILSVFTEGPGLASMRAAFSLKVLGVALLSALPWFWQDIRKARGLPSMALERTCFRYYGAMVLLLLLISLFGVYGEGFSPQEFLYFRF